MDELQKLYDLLVSEGLYTNSFDEFKVKWSGEKGYQDKVFDVVSRDGFYTKDKGSFISKYGVAQEKKNSQPPLEMGATALPLADGSLESAPTEKLMVGPMGMTGIERTTKSKPKDGQGFLLNVVSSLDKGIYNLPGEAIKGVGTLLEGVTGKGFVSDALNKFGSSYLKAIEELTPQDESFKGSLSDQFGQAFGQVAGMILTSGASQAAKATTAISAAKAALASQAAPKAVTIGGAVKKLASELSDPAAVSMGLAMGQGEFERAKQAGATDEQAFEAFYKNAAVGSVLEKIPVMQFLKRFEKASAGGIANYLKTKSVSGLVGGVEEMTTEVLQQLYANQTAKDIYNINQNLFEGVGESGGVGFGVGFLLNAMGANAKLLRKQGRNEEADIVENQMAQFESKVESKPAPIYKVNGIKVELPALNDIIDNTNAADLIKLNIDIQNDVELRDRLQDKIVTSSIMEQVREANPDLNEPSLKAITELEKQLQKLEGNKTQSGKDKAAAVRQQIKNIQENPLTEEVKTADKTKIRTDRIAELEALLLSDDKTDNRSMSAEARIDIEDELKKLKTEQDAIQEQGAATGVPSTEQPQLGLQEMGEGNAQPQGTPPGTQEVVAPQPGQEEVIFVETEFDKDLYKDKKKAVLNNEEIEFNRLNTKGEENVFTIEKNGEEIGRATLSNDGNYLENIRINEEYRRQGLATKMYDYIEQQANIKLQPSPVKQSKAAKELWKKRTTMEPIVSLKTQPAVAPEVAQEQGQEEINQKVTETNESFEGFPISVFSGNIFHRTNSDVSQIKENGFVVPTGGRAKLGYGIYSTISGKETSFGKNEIVGDVEGLKMIDIRNDEFGDKINELQNIASDGKGGVDFNLLTNKLKENGIDGVITDSEFVVFNPNKIQNIRERITEKAVSSKTQPAAEVAPATTTETATITAPEVVVEPIAEPVAEPEIVAPVVEEEPVEQYEPITVKDTNYEPFTKYNATDYEEGEREADNGRTYTYLASITVPLMDADGNTIGFLKKLVSEDDELSFNAENLDGEDLDLDGYETLGQAKQALIDDYNKTKKKEFDKEAKKAAKKKISDSAKAAAKAERTAAKEAEKAAKAAAKAAAITTTTTTPTTTVPSTEAPVATDTLEALLDADVTIEKNKSTILDVLNKADKAITDRLRGGANDALLAIPLSTVQLVIKGLKVLVRGGMILRDALRKVAADNNISQQLVKDILNVSEIQDKFDALMLKVDAMVTRQRARGTAQDRMVSNIDTFVRKSEVYQEANDAQKKILEREARARAGAAERRAPSIGRILGVLKDITNVSREDKLKIISQIRQLSKGAAQELANEMRELAKSGKIIVKQAANIVSRFGKVNMLSEISVSKFVDYMTKVFNDAEYANKLSIGKSLNKDLAKLSKNKEKNANLRDLAKEFVKINPSMVNDIDAYNAMASKIKEAIVGSKIRGEKVSFAATIDIENATEYINQTLEEQRQKLREEKIAQIQELMGVDASTFSYEDMMMLLEKAAPITKYNEGIIRDTINNMFDVFSSMIDKTINTGKDVFTGEDVFFTDGQKDVVKRFMAMDLNTLSPKDALQAVDALANFLQNQSTAKMETIVSKYTGIQNAKKVKARGIKAFPLKKYWSKTIGKLLGEQTTNLNVLFERMFKGFNAGGYVMDMMGLTKLINNKSLAETEANRIVKTYVDLFYDKKANGEVFNSAYNNIERGMAAFMMRNVVGTEAEMVKEFNRRLALIKESIDVLSQGNEREVAKAKLYQEVYDKILADSKNIDDIKSKIDATNLDAIDFWMNEWDKKFDKLSEVAENVYNKTLDKDINYTPDKFFKLSSNTGTVVIDDEDSAFLINSGINNLYQRETGVLMNAVRPESLPVDPENGDANMYIDLSFDSNNSNSMYDALVDINTAAPIRQIQAFLNSSDFKNIVPDTDNAKILKSRVQLYVRNIRDKNPFTNDELSSMVKKLNKLAAIGVGQALGGVTQPLKQVIPVAINTLINGGGLDIMAAFDADKNNFINNSGYSIASRGIESQAQIESLNKLVEEVSKSKGEKLLNGIEKLNKWWLNNFLVKPDVFIARASWMTYYEQYLNRNGVDTKGLDYSTHQIDEDAANYAQRMVDRQQNISDIDLAGKLFSNKESSSQILIKTLMPFASFRMNQSARLGADLATLTNKTSTKEDKKIAARSVGGFAAEIVTFRAISIGIALLLGSLAKAIMGKPEDDEEYEKRKKGLIKGALTGTFTDVFSPVPVTDKFIQLGGAPLMQYLEDATKLPVSIYSPRKEEFLQNAGLFGIVGDRANQLFEISKLAVTGKYTDDFGKEKTISSKDKDGLALLIAPALLTNTGLAPSEMNSIIRYAIKDAKKKTKSEKETLSAAENKKQREESKNQKLEALNNLRQTTQDQELRSAINDKIRELNGSPEAKQEMKEQNAREKEIKQKLLIDTKTGEEYDTESELKRYNKPLWDKNFGPDSEWSKSREDDDEVTKLLNKEIRRMEDEEYGYTPKTRRKKSTSFGGSGFGSQRKKTTGFGPQNKKGSGFGPQ
jgi:ribosomal protein S18 acetylase RimI-like enzyme